MGDFAGFMLLELLEKALGKKTPKWVAILILTLLLGLLIYFFISVGFTALYSNDIFFAVFCWLIGFLFIILWIYSIYRIIKLPKNHI